MIKKISAVFAALFAFSAVFSASADGVESQEYTQNKIGKFGGFDFELWRDTGEALMTVNKDGTFICEWDRDKTGNVLFRTGKKLGSTQTYEEIGDISLEYACDYQPDGNSYLCVYGWSVDPLVEFYILENFTVYNPGLDGTTFKGIVMIDGSTYKLYEGERVDKPSIKGNTTFKQYWSIRDTKRTKGTISVSEHFKAWEEVGMNLGQMYEVSLCVEGHKSSGYANIYSNKLTIGDTVIGSVKELDADIEETSENTEAVQTTADTSEITAEASDADVAASDGDSGSVLKVVLIIAAGVIAVAGVLFVILRRQKK